MEVLEYIFGQYKDYSTFHIILEVIMVITAIISVLYSKRNSVLVFPYGIISTAIFSYLLYEWNLLGDMMINMYYFIMSVYGWYIWTRKGAHDQETPITSVTLKEWLISLLLVVVTAIAVYILYVKTNRLEHIVSYIDMITTGIFFAGMWLMALRKIEHWLVLFIGNVISVPLYFYKGYSFSALLYIFLAIIAVIGYVEWKKYLNNENFLEKK
ncbi:nicotinamide riboside transporter PnuC [Nonlabens sp.]|uniref:nicotinamide riboside transporter PnuC n=1 Tax=Nonlabens sp. TaxID=1888209 RepID=UPI003F699293